MISAEEGEEDKLLYPDPKNVVEDLAGYIMNTLLHIIESLLDGVFRLNRTGIDVRVQCDGISSHAVT